MQTPQQQIPTLILAMLLVDVSMKTSATTTTSTDVNTYAHIDSNIYTNVNADIDTDINANAQVMYVNFQP